MHRFLQQALNVKDGEGASVSLLLTYSFFMGLALSFFITGATSFFLESFGNSSLPTMYIASGVVSYFLLHEVPDDWKRAVVDGLLERVKPGGKAVFMDYHEPGLWHPLKPLMSVVFDRLEPFAKGLWGREIADLAAPSPESGERWVMYPCRVSDPRAPWLEGPEAPELLFLDQTPDPDSFEPASTLLIGCDLSLRLFKSIYLEEPARFVTICPRDLYDRGLADGTISEGEPVLLKCCRVKTGATAWKGAVVVPWGALLSDVAEGIARCLPRSPDDAE